MSIVRVRIAKWVLTPDTMWENRYLFETGPSEVSDPINFIHMIATHEQAFHGNPVHFYLGSLDYVDAVEPTITVPLDSVGDLTLAGDMIPPILVVRCQLGASFGRPGMKYYHVCVDEARMTNGLWANTFQQEVEGEVQLIHDDALNDFECQGIINETTQPDWVTTTAVQWVGTHQFHKHKRPSAA